MYYREITHLSCSKASELQFQFGQENGENVCICGKIFHLVSVILIHPSSIHAAVYENIENIVSKERKTAKTMSQSAQVSTSLLHCRFSADASPYSLPSH